MQPLSAQGRNSQRGDEKKNHPGFKTWTETKVHHCFRKNELLTQSLPLPVKMRPIHSIAPCKMLSAQARGRSWGPGQTGRGSGRGRSLLRGRNGSVTSRPGRTTTAQQPASRVPLLHGEPVCEGPGGLRCRMRHQAQSEPAAGGSKKVYLEHLI